MSSTCGARWRQFDSGLNVLSSQSSRENDRRGKDESHGQPSHWNVSSLKKRDHSLSVWLQVTCPPESEPTDLQVGVDIGLGASQLCGLHLGARYTKLDTDVSRYGVELDELKVDPTQLKVGFRRRF